jgi:malonyl-CoA O-methyltransferase
MHCEYLPATGAAQQELVLLHGWGSNREVWRPLLVLLRPWANVTLLDLPGCTPGAAAGDTPELEQLLTDILDRSPARAVYVGWSLGGQLAVELAAREPARVAALVTICSNPRFVATGDWPGMAADTFDEFYADISVDPVTALRRFDTLQVGGARQPRQLLRQLRDLGRRPASGELLAGLNWLHALDQRDALSALTQPRLHVFAERDALVPAAVAEAVADRSANISAARTATTASTPAQVHLLNGTCHLAPLEAPAEMAQAIREFLAVSGQLRTSPPVAAELEKKTVAASFSRAAAEYDSAAHLQREIGEQLLTYLERGQCQPATVLDLGCGTGYFCPELQRRYAGAQYLGFDIAAGMVDHARARYGNKGGWLVGDAEALPLASESIDLVFSSLVLQWCARPEHLFAELGRVLTPGSKCVFTTLGPQTLCELRAAWATVDAHQHVNTFLPASALEAAAAAIPGVTVQLASREVRTSYTRVRDLLDELKALGAHNMNRSRPAGLTSRRALQGMLQAYEERRAGGVLPATYEVIFGVLEKI